MRHDRRGSTAVEFAIVAPVFLLLMFGIVEYARLLWEWQALQLAADRTARCVAIGNSACGTAQAYAITTAANFGAPGLLASGVIVDTQTGLGGVCTLPGANTATRVRLNLTFSTPASQLTAFLPTTLTVTACYLLTGA